MSRSTIRRGYVDTRWGQLHYREAGSGPAAALVCLHATAYSSRTFLPLLPRLTGRRVIAIDTPGYGGSDGPDSLPTFPDYAEVVAEAIAALKVDGAVDVLGYHTGALLATEIAAAHPALLRRLVLIGIPAFDGLAKQEWQRRLVHEHVLGEGLDQFAARWEFFVAERAPGVSLQRGFDSFVDELRAYPRDFWAHKAIFDYDALAALGRFAHPVLVINPDAPLAETSRQAAAMMQDARVLEIPELSASIFDLGPDRLASAMLDFLDAPQP